VNQIKNDLLIIGGDWNEDVTSAVWRIERPAPMSTDPYIYDNKLSWIWYMFPWLLALYFVQMPETSMTIIRGDYSAIRFDVTWTVSFSTTSTK